GPADLILIVNGKKITVFSKYTGDWGNTLFLGLIDPDGIKTLSIMTTGGGMIYLDRLMTIGMPQANIITPEVANATTPEPGTFGLVVTGLGALLIKRKMHSRGSRR